MNKRRAATVIVLAAAGALVAGCNGGADSSSVHNPNDPTAKRKAQEDKVADLESGTAYIRINGSDGSCTITFRPKQRKGGKVLTAWTYSEPKGDWLHHHKLCMVDHNTASQGYHLSGKPRKYVLDHNHQLKITYAGISDVVVDYNGGGKLAMKNGVPVKACYVTRHVFISSNNLAGKTAWHDQTEKIVGSDACSNGYAQSEDAFRAMVAGKPYRRSELKIRRWQEWQTDSVRFGKR